MTNRLQTLLHELKAVRRPDRLVCYRSRGGVSRSWLRNDCLASAISLGRILARSQMDHLTYLNQMTLTLEALSFYVHALDRFSCPTEQ